MVKVMELHLASLGSIPAVCAESGVKHQAYKQIGYIVS